MTRHVVRNEARTLDIACLGYRTAPHASLALWTMLGQAVPMITTQIVLLRRRLYPSVGPWVIVGMADEGDSTIQNAAGFALENEMGFQFTVGRMHPNGFASVFAEPLRLDVDNAGDEIIPRLPMFPRHVFAEPALAGALRVSWQYDGFGQGAPPTDFQVFEGSAAGSIDYMTPLTDTETGLDHVLFDPAAQYFEMTTDETWSAGTLHWVAVRARSSAGVAELNQDTFGPVTATVGAPAAPVPSSSTQPRG